MLLTLVEGSVYAASQSNLTKQLKCTIDAKKAVWSPTNGAVISIRVENISSHPLDLSVRSIVQLKNPNDPRGDKYWSAVSLISKSSLKANDTEPLRLKSGEALEVEVDPSNLKWDRSISAVWPSHPLFDAVPPGRYILEFRIETKNANVDSSPPIPVTIAK